MVRWVIRLILHGGPIELFLIPASAPLTSVTKAGVLLSSLWDGAYKRPLAAKGKELSMRQQRISSRYLSGTSPYVQCHITINEMC